MKKTACCCSSKYYQNLLEQKKYGIFIRKVHRLIFPKSKEIVRIYYIPPTGTFPPELKVRMPFGVLEVPPKAPADAPDTDAEDTAKFPPVPVTPANADVDVGPSPKSVAGSLPYELTGQTKTTFKN
jgi:hypothetical protein